MQVNKIEILQNFSTRLKGFMEDRRATLKDVADGLNSLGCDVKVSTVAAWKSSKNFPSMEVVPALAEYFNTSPQFLIYGISEETKSASRISERPNQEVSKKAGNYSRPVSKQRDRVLSLNEDQAPYARKEVKEEDCIRHLANYLEFAREVHGGIGHCYTQLKLHLPIDTIKRLKEEEENA